jgi:DNA repair photolyase
MHYADYKTILSPKNGMNLYRGCSHGCVYCDSRSACYHIDHDFEDIEVKRNAPRILEEQLRRRRKPCMIATGAMCDPYVPLEEELQITRQCLAVVERYGFGLSILTKSSRILRDLDLLRTINENAKCVAQMTLTTAAIVVLNTEVNQMQMKIYYCNVWFAPGRRVGVKYPSPL